MLSLWPLRPAGADPLGSALLLGGGFGVEHGEFGGDVVASARWAVADVGAPLFLGITDRVQYAQTSLERTTSVLSIGSAFGTFGIIWPELRVGVVKEGDETRFAAGAAVGTFFHVSRWLVGGEYSGLVTTDGELDLTFTILMGMTR